MTTPVRTRPPLRETERVRREDRPVSPPVNPSAFRRRQQPLPGHAPGRPARERRVTPGGWRSHVAELGANLDEQMGSGRRRGSRQVTAYRGRRIAPQAANPTKVRFALTIVLLLAMATVVSLFLSGVATKQAFIIEDLTTRETAQSRELETLHRNLEDVKSAAEIANAAVASGSVVPVQSGILTVDPTGAVIEQRPADPAAVLPLIDVNGEPVRTPGASSDPKDTDTAAQAVVAVPRNASGSVPQGMSGIAPYAVNSAKKPAE
ncbi:MAG: hypothetical protein SPI77_09015 [Corynebacterium sp.]|nr:hypothetical protein [Corynebacterium sp.]